MIGSLYLTPMSPEDVCDLELLAQALATLQVTAEPIATGEQCRVYYAGDGFARHVVFAGCSPYLRFEPRDAQDRHYCHVALHGPFADPRVVTGQNTVKPRCPHCRARLADWRKRLDLAAAACAACGGQVTAASLDWRQHAAVGRSLVELRNVFPGEASPSDQLLHTLAEHTGFGWRHAWSTLLDTCPPG